MNYLYWIGLFLAMIAGAVIGIVVYNITGHPGFLKFISVVIAGGFGGLIQGVIEDGGSGKLRFPRAEITTDNDVVADLGIFGELLVGMMGAVVSILVIAVFLGSDPFTDPNSPVSIFRLIAFGALAGFAARQFLPNLAKRFSEQLEEQFRESTNAMEKKIHEEAETVAEAQKSRAENIRLASAPQLNPVALQAMGGFNADSIAPLVQQFTEITYISHPNDRERVRAMMDLADKMVENAPANPQVKLAIDERITSAAEKAWLLPLSTLIAAKPEEGDASRLFDAYDRALSDAAERSKTKFILYRILLAIIAMSDTLLLPSELKPRAQKIAQACQAIGDPSLARRAKVVLDLLQ